MSTLKKDLANYLVNRVHGEDEHIEIYESEIVERVDGIRVIRVTGESYDEDGDVMEICADLIIDAVEYL